MRSRPSSTPVSPTSVSFQPSSAAELTYPQVFEYPLQLSKPETHKATDDLIRHLTKLIPALNLPLPEQKDLASLTSAFYEERTALRAKSVDMALKVTACREKMAVVMRQQEKRDRRNGKNCDSCDDEDEEEEEDDDGEDEVAIEEMLAGLDDIDSEETWLRFR